ncbi:MAG: hypothetical protein BWY87_00846 [Deltaproteobacteria bacterium ADurb.Bin510]|nr:MAG: hypothetical protein BWY87_00846 [Deltaproteobacteria bacterium ADurb.Bin510]
MNKCISYCLAKTFDFEPLCEHLSSSFRSVRYRDVVHLQLGHGDGFVFSFGVVVLWGLSHDDSARLLDEVRLFEQEPLKERILDEFSYELNLQGEARIHQDHIVLASPDIKERLALSHALAQSLKLAQFEDYVWQTIEATNHIPRKIAASGRTSLSRRELARMRGRLYLVESDVNINYDLLDTPEFFWEYPEYEHLYSLAANYLEVRPRIEVLNKKLNVIHDLFDMLAEEQNHQHAAVLEWIIIGLIAVEVAIIFLQDIFKVF